MLHSSCSKETPNGMRIATVGLWHLGTVTSACLASVGHEVLAIDENSEVIAALNEAQLPVHEPGLAKLVEAQLKCGKLKFSSQLAAVAGYNIVWVTYDTPVDENDIADIDSVIERATALLPMMSDGAIMLISSQLPVGSTARLESRYRELALSNGVRFAYAPENLRLGKAIDAFLRPDRVVVGVRSRDDEPRLLPIWAPFTNQLEWMSVESAEMTKHAINAFLATSVSFINEIARICEQVGADARDVERGLKSDSRIGRRAYLRPGAAFGGGTLARDIMFLRRVEEQSGLDPALFDGIKLSNDLQKNWLQHRFAQCVGSPRGKTVGVLGLTYKPDTSSVRRSGAVEICRWLSNNGAAVVAFDPAVKKREPEIPDSIGLANSVEQVLTRADALLIATEWPEFRWVSPDAVVQRMNKPVVIDPFGHVEATLGRDKRVLYYSVGRGPAIELDR